MQARWLRNMVVLAVLAATSSSAATTYVYDTLGRVSTVTYDNGLQVVYTYDAAGNRIAVVTQTGTNRPPQANNDSVSVFKNTLIHIHPLVNDVDPDGDTLQITQVGAASHGTATRANLSTVNYTPATDYQGQDSFIYTISDGHGHTASATIFAAVATGIPPIAVNDSINTPYQTAIQFDPRTNDTEPSPPGLPLTISSVTQPSNGAVAINSGTAVTYTPASGFEGADGFSYTISDGVSQTASATVTVFVGAPPNAVADYTPTPTRTPVTFNPRVNDNDPYNLQITIASATNPAHGSAAVNNGVSMTYTPVSGYTGPDNFTYTIVNSAGLTATATDYMCPGNVPPLTTAHTMNIDVSHPINDPIYPTGTYDPRAQPPANIGDTDPCGGPLTVTAVTQGAKGKVSINPSGPPITYMYNELVYAGRQDTDTFTYTVTDAFGLNSTGTVNVVIDVETNN